MAMQRSQFALTCAIDEDGTPVAGEPRVTPTGATTGGAQVVAAETGEGESAGWNGGGITVRLEYTTWPANPNASPPAPVAGAQWLPLPAGVSPELTADGTQALGDGNNIVDVTPATFVRAVPLVSSGAPEGIAVTVACVFDYQS